LHVKKVVIYLIAISRTNGHILKANLSWTWQ